MKHLPSIGCFAIATPYSLRQTKGWRVVYAHNKHGGKGLMMHIEEAVVAKALDAEGFAVLPHLLAPEECAALATLYAGDGFRSTVTMEQHGFGMGVYRYFAYPLPPLVQRLRETLYPPLARIANDWEARLGGSTIWPPAHAALLNRCALAGQARPTPLLLRYDVGDYNRLHQDVYGALTFPLQVILLLSVPEQDFTGGELVLVEGRTRMQSRPIVVPLRQGDAAIVPVRERPIREATGWARAKMHHGVAALRSGQRHTLGIIFHDAS
jgi:uncharacterized protein